MAKNAVKVGGAAPRLVRPIHMEQGSIGVIRDGVHKEYDGLRVLRCYGDCMVSLEDGVTWSGLEYNTMQIEVLPPGTKIEITVG